MYLQLDMHLADNNNSASISTNIDLVTAV